MITELGKFLRILRIQHGEEARTMAEKLGFSPSYLSSIENGKRKVPTNIEEKISQSYSLSEREKEKLRQALISSSETLKIDIGRLNDNKKNLILAMTQENIDDSTIEKIYTMVKEGRKQK